MPSFQTTEVPSLLKITNNNSNINNKIAHEVGVLIFNSHFRTSFLLVKTVSCLD